MKLNKPKKKLFKFIKCKLIVFYYQRIHSIFSDSLDKARMQFIAGIHDPNYSDLYKRYKMALDYVNRYSKIPQKIGNIKGEYLNIIEAARKQDAIYEFPSKEEQKKHIVDIMEADENDKIYS